MLAAFVPTASALRKVVVVMPPTLIASIYGMNFKNMPELDHPFGYPLALLSMVLAAVLPYVFFKWKRWL
jgi:magnesium transporter